MTRVNNILNNALFRKSMNELKEAEKARIFCNHSIEHLLSVARIMQINALENSIEIDKEIIYATALLHDIGRAKAYALKTDHAKESAETAKKILSECGFEKNEIERVTAAVAHHNDSEKADDLCKLLRKADKLSRNCFDCSAYEQCNWSEEKKNRGITV